jgi:hypothetical protein
MKFKSTIAYVFALLACAELAANDPSQIYTVNFRLMALPPLQQNPRGSMDSPELSIYDIRYISGEKTKKIASIPYLNQSSEYRYSGPSPLVFFRQTSEAGGAMVKNILAEVDIADSKSNILILALPREENAVSGFGSYVLADDLDSFPLNSFRIINFSSNRIACLIDGKREIVEPRGESTIELSIAEPRMVPFRLATYDADTEEWRQTTSNSVPFYGISRVLCLMLPDPSSEGKYSRPMIVLDLGPTHIDDDQEEELPEP